MLVLEDEHADVGHVNLTPIPQQAPTRTEEDVPLRSVGEYAPLRLAEQVCPTLTNPNAPLRSVGEDAPSRSEEQVYPAPTDPIGGLKQLITYMAESELSDQPLKCSRIMESR